MTIVELLAALKTSNPKAFAKLNDMQVRQVTTAVLGTLGKMVDQTGEDGVLAIATLGRFKVKMVASKQDPAVKTRRVIFTRAKALPVAVKTK